VNLLRRFFDSILRCIYASAHLDSGGTYRVMEDQSFGSFIWSYLLVLSDFWWTIIPGLLLSLVDVVERIMGEEMPVSRSWYLRLFLLAIIGSQIGAYWKLNKEVLSTKPNISLALGSQVYRGTSGEGKYCFYLNATLLNKGTDGAVMKWYAVSDSPFKNDVWEIDHPMDETVFTDGHTNITVGKADDITGKSRKGVLRGIPMDGIIFTCAQSGSRDEAVYSGSFELTITAEDYLGRKTSDTFKPNGKPLPEIKFQEGLRATPSVKR